MIFWLKFVIFHKNCLKIEICIQNWFKIDDSIRICNHFWLRFVIFDKNCFKIKICIQNWFKMDSKLGFAFIFDSDFMHYIHFWFRLIKNSLELWGLHSFLIQMPFKIDSNLGFAFIFDSNVIQNWITIRFEFIFVSKLWFLVRIDLKLRFACIFGSDVWFL